MDVEFALKTTPDANFYWKFVKTMPVKTNDDHQIAQSLLQLFRTAMEHNLDFVQTVNQTAYHDTIKVQAAKAFEASKIPPKLQP